MRHAGFARILLVFAAQFVVLILGSCGPGNPPPTGFRLRSGFVPTPFAQPCSGPPVAGVATSGTVISIQGPGGGTEVIFMNHFTDEFGIDDHVNGRVNATWNFSFDFTPGALPACGTGVSMPGIYIAPPPMVNIICGDCICDSCVILSGQSNHRTCS